MVVNFIANKINRFFDGNICKKSFYIITYFFLVFGQWYPSRHEMSLTCLHQISIERDISKTSKKYLQRDAFFVTSLRHLRYSSKRMVFFVMSLRRLTYISKKMSFCDVLKASQIYLKQDVFFVMSLRRLKYMSKRCLFVMSLRRLKYILKKMSFLWRL